MSEPIVGGCPVCLCHIYLIKETGCVRPTCKCQDAEFVTVRLWKDRHIVMKAGATSQTGVQV